MAGASTYEEANRVLEEIFLSWWEARCTVQPEHPDDAHRPLDRGHNLEAILSIVHSRQVMRAYTFRFQNQLDQIERADMGTGLRVARLRIEQRLEATMAVAFQRKYLRYRKCETAVPIRDATPAKPARAPAQQRRRTLWVDNFDLPKSMPVWRAARAPERPRPNATRL